jgi:hypothetical protein
MAAQSSSKSSPNLIGTWILTGCNDTTLPDD